jgi:hypothetical protein
VAGGAVEGVGRDGEEVEVGADATFAVVVDGASAEGGTEDAEAGGGGEGGLDGGGGGEACGEVAEDGWERGEGKGGMRSAGCGIVSEVGGVRGFERGCFGDTIVETVGVVGLSRHAFQFASGGALVMCREGEFGKKCGGLDNGYPSTVAA